jgi:hypothetical protein
VVEILDELCVPDTRGVDKFVETVYTMWEEFQQTKDRNIVPRARNVAQLLGLCKKSIQEASRQAEARGKIARLRIKHGYIYIPVDWVKDPRIVAFLPKVDTDREV